MPKIMLMTLVLASLLAGCTTSPAGKQLDIVPPIQITEAERFRDGGSLRLQFIDQNKRPILVHMDFRWGGMREGEVLWVPRGTNKAWKLVPGGDQERDLISVLQIWLDESAPVESRDRLSAMSRPPAEPANDYVTWMVMRMIRTLQMRAAR